MRLAAGVPQEACVDTDTILSGSMCAALRAAGIKGVFRYLSDLTVSEITTILVSGLKLYFVNHSRDPGWIPSGAEGKLDGERDVGQLQKLGVPRGVHIAFDLEGVGGGNPAAVMAHVNAWAAEVQAAGYLAALYVGEQALLTSAQLYALLVTLYWVSASLIRDIAGIAAVPECDWAIIQGRPVDVVVAGVTVDFDTIYEDNKGRVPIGVAA